MRAAIWAARGRTLPAVSNASVRKICMPPTRSSGRNTIATTMMPTPPNHCSIERQTRTPRGRVSSPLNTVDPVVVRPDIASKNASTARASGSPSMNGIAPKTGSISQTPVVSRKVCWIVRRLSDPVGAGQRHQPAGHRGDDRGFQEDRPVIVAIEQIERHRQQHGGAEAADKQADHISHGAQVKHGAQAWPRGRVLSSKQGLWAATVSNADGRFALAEGVLGRGSAVFFR